MLSDLKKNKGIFTEHSVSKNVHKIQARYTVDGYYEDIPLYEQGNIHKELVYELIAGAYDSGLINIQSYKMAGSYRTQFIATLRATNSPGDFITDDENFFVVADEKFTNEELAEAVKIAFPERFL